MVKTISGFKTKKIKYKTSQLYCPHYFILGSVMLFTMFLSGCNNKDEKNEIAIIPKPQVLEETIGTYDLSSSTHITINNDLLNSSANHFSDQIQSITGRTIPVINNKDGKQVIKNNIALIIDEQLTYGEEGYELQIDDTGVKVKGATPNGVFYGIQSLLQLFPTSKNGTGFFKSYELPYVKIIDQPAFKWRGVMLDVCRHFFSVDYIKRVIDVMAYHKMNTVHWHLTEDQGWRIEIDEFPNLTSIGAWRDSTVTSHLRDIPDRYDGKKYGGFYTKAEIKEVVQYAQERFITIVPEIELPGHASAALASYPHLGCTGGPYKVATKWGIFDDIYCAGDEGTFEFLTKVFDEVIELFPGEVIHIGGDEAPKTRWKACSKCQKRIKEEGLQDEYELQSYFIKRIEKYLNSKGRVIIGWDEILEGGLAPNAKVMSWRGEKGGITAAKQGHEVVMTPSSHVYFDHYQGDPVLEPLAYRGNSTLKKVYSYNPVPAVLPEDKKQYILGVQANLWAEYVKSDEHAEYMLFPRVSALSEVAWTSSDNKDWNDFAQRMQTMYKRYESFGVNYSKSAFDVLMTAKYCKEDHTMAVELSNSADKRLPIYYTIDGSEPTVNSIIYEAGIKVSEPTIIKAATFDGEKVLGKISEKKVFVNKAVGAKIKLKAYPNWRSTNWDLGLINGFVGTLDHVRDRAEWNGYYAKDMEATLDFGEIIQTDSVIVSFLKNPFVQIDLPQNVIISASVDGKEYKMIGEIPIPVNVDSSNISKVFYRSGIITNSFRYFRISTVADQSEDSGKWCFVDEIILK